MSDAEDDATLSADQAKKLASEMPKIRVALFAESDQKLAFIVTPKRIDVEKLLDDPGGLFSPRHI